MITEEISGILFDFIEGRQDCPDKIGVLSVLAVVHRDDSDRFHLFPFDSGHAEDLLVRRMD